MTTTIAGQSRVFPGAIRHEHIENHPSVAAATFTMVNSRLPAISQCRSSLPRVRQTIVDEKKLSTSFGRGRVVTTSDNLVVRLGALQDGMDFEIAHPLPSLERQGQEAHLHSDSALSDYSGHSRSSLLISTTLAFMWSIVTGVVGLIIRTPLFLYKFFTNEKEAVKEFEGELLIVEEEAEDVAKVVDRVAHDVAKAAAKIAEKAEDAEQFLDKVEERTKHTEDKLVDALGDLQEAVQPLADASGKAVTVELKVATKPKIPENNAAPDEPTALNPEADETPTTSKTGPRGEPAATTSSSPTQAVISVNHGNTDTYKISAASTADQAKNGSTENQQRSLKQQLHNFFTNLLTKCLRILQNIIVVPGNSVHLVSNIHRAQRRTSILLVMLLAMSMWATNSMGLQELFPRILGATMSV